MKKSFKRFTTLSVALGMLLSSIPALPTRAATVIGSLNGKNYTDFDKLRDDLEDDYKGKAVTIEMKSNWDAAVDSDFNERLIIPASCRATLNMNSFVFDRDNSAEESGWEFNGELIDMESGSTLIINGGSEKTAHSEPVYNSKSSDAVADKWTTFYGGVLTGGSSTNGAGGIHVKDQCNLVLNDVTIAGCRAEVPWYDSAGTRSGFGAGIWIVGGNTSVVLNNSTITGCHAQNDGGGIFGSNSNNMRIELVNSHVDYNFSRSDGGGIDLDGEKLVIKGDGKSTVSGNDTNGLGGGLYIWNDEVTVSGLIIHDNKAKKGGGVYTTEEDISLTGLDIKNNTASELGGGIYVENDDTTIADCTVTGNKNYGVFVESDVDTGFNVNGKTIIKDNEKGNLTLEDGSSRMLTALTRGADIHLGYYNKITSAPYYHKISSEQTSDQRQYFTSDDKDYVITYSFDEDILWGRRHYYVKKGTEYDGVGHDIEKPEKVTLSPAEAGPKIVARVKAGGEKAANGEYALIRGFLHHEKTDSNVEDTDSLYYYSDGLFFGDPKTYNDHLATASWNLAFGGTYLREGVNDLDMYKYKHAGARQFLADIGCPDQNIYVNDSDVSKPGTDTIGVIIGSKKLQHYNGDNLEDTDYTLIPVAVRGGGYESEWASNVTLGRGGERGGEAQGFSEAADGVIKSIEYYISKYELEDELEAGKVKFWVSGFSRAGATANLTSKRLIEKYCYDSDGTALGNQVFAYPCEPAKGGTDMAEKLTDKTCYYCIHNLINAGDIVPLVGPVEMGFKHYGVDHYIPGTTAGGVSKSEAYASGRQKRVGVSGISSVTNYTDNQHLKTKAPAKGESSLLFDQYKTRREKMLKNLASIDSSMPFDDLFVTQGVQMFPMTFGKTGDYDGSYREDFIDDFLAFFQKYSVTSRDVWSNQQFALDGKEYGTIQKSMRDAMKLVFSLSDEESAGIAEKAGAITDAMSVVSLTGVDLINLFDDVLGDWNSLDDKTKMKYIQYFWDLVDNSGALDYLPAEEVSKLENDWPIIANMIFSFTDGDWDSEIDEDYTYPSGRKWVTNADGAYMMYTMTLKKHIGSILANHYPEINIAWTRTYDSYYDSEEAQKEYIIDWGGNHTVDMPAAQTVEGEELLPDDRTANAFTGDQKVILEVGIVGSAKPETNTIGEAIYYDLEDVTDGDSSSEIIEKEMIYRGGIDLSVDEGDASKLFKITTYARSYGVNSEKEIYYIGVLNDKHQVKVITKEDTDGGITDKEVESTYKEENDATVAATVPDSMIFDKWVVTDGEGNDVTAKLFKNGEEESKSVTFTMPKGGSDGFSAAYSLTFTAQYKSKISEVFVDAAAPFEGTVLDDKAVVKWGDADDEKDEFSISWSYDGAGKTVPVLNGSEALQSTVYTAKITVPMDESVDRIFAPVVTGSAFGDSASKVQSVNVSLNSADGSIIITVVFAPTGDTGGEIQPEADVTLTVNTLDLSTMLPDTSVPYVEYSTIQGATVTIDAPDVTSEQFVEWDMGESGVTILRGTETDKSIDVTIPTELTENSLSITAKYVPVLRQARVTMDAPEAGKPLPNTAKLVVSIENEYEVDPDFLEITWAPAPEDGKAQYLVSYAPTVKLAPKQDGSGNSYIKVRPNGSTVDYERIEAKFVAAYNIKAYFNDAKATFNVDDNSVSGLFDPIKYTLSGIKPVENISGLDHNSGQSEVAAVLPATTKIVVDEGKELDAEMIWEAPVKVSGTDPLDAAVWTAAGTVVLPDTVLNPNEIDLDVTVNVGVDEAPAVNSPKASITSGKYLADQLVTLSSKTEGAVIYYTIDGSEPTAASTRYDGENILVERNGAHTVNGIFTLRAIALKDGMRPSTESYYEYEFTNSIDIPKGHELTYNFQQQIGVNAGVCFTLEPVSDGVTIDDLGNAVAENAGTYKVRAKADAGFNWLVEPVYAPSTDTTVDPDKDYYQYVGGDTSYARVNDNPGDNPAANGWYEMTNTSTEDQIIEFTIAQLDITDMAKVSHDASYDTREDLEKNIKISVQGYDLDKDDYTISYDKSFGPAVMITIAGKGNLKGAVNSVVEIKRPSTGDEASLSFDPSGGVLRGSTNAIVISAKVGDTIQIIEAPTRAGYKFLYWKGSEYHPGDAYVVTGDHAFTAQWEVQNEPVTESSKENSKDPGKKNTKKKSSTKKSSDDDSDEDEDVSSPEGSSTNDKSGVKTASTGDKAPLILLFIIAGVSLVMILLIIIKKRKDRE